MIWSLPLQVAPVGVKLRPRRSQEVRGSLELQNGGLRALEEAWMTTFRLRHFLLSLVVVCASFGASRWLQEVSSYAQGDLRSLGKA